MALQTLAATLKFILTLGSSFAASSRSTARLSDDSDSVNISVVQGLTLGTGAKAANQYFQDVRTLAASTAELLNISNGAAGGAVALLNPYAEAVAFAKITGILIVNTSTTGTLTIGGDATYDLTTLFGANADKVRIRPGGTFFMNVGDADATAMAVATDEVLKISNEDGANALTYQIVLIGVKV